MTPTQFTITVSHEEHPPQTDPRPAASVIDARRIALDEVETARAYWPGHYIEDAWHLMADATQRIGDHGAIIGPCPDGTIIDVRPAEQRNPPTFDFAATL